MPKHIYERFAGPRPDVILGETGYRGRATRFGLLDPDRLRHVWVVGKTGVGKSTLLTNLIAQDLQRGAGVGVLDPHGTLVAEVLKVVPEERERDVLLFAADDAAWPVSWNVFRQGRHPVADRPLLVSQLIAVFKKRWSDSWGPRLEHVLRNALLAVAEHPEATLLMVYRFLTDSATRERVLALVTDPVVRRFWEAEFKGYGQRLQAEATAPVLNKLGSFVAMPQVRHIVGQVRSRVDLVETMDHGNVVLADLATGRLGEDASGLLGGLLLTSLQLAAMNRTRPDRPFFLYVDEFQNFVTDSLATMLAEARKFGLGLTLAHQYLEQLPPALLAAVRGNTGTVLAFRVGAIDADELAPEFAPVLEGGDVAALPAYHVAVRMLVAGAEARPFTARTLPPPAAGPGAAERAARIREYVRRTYCRDREAVAGYIERELTAP